jgi:hypothetical protein
VKGGIRRRRRHVIERNVLTPTPHYMQLLSPFDHFVNFPKDLVLNSIVDYLGQPIDRG